MEEQVFLAISADAEGFERVVVELGPFGGAKSAGIELWLWSAAYLVIVGALASWAFSRRDL